MKAYRHLSPARLTTPVLCFASSKADEQVVSQGDIVEMKFSTSAEVNEEIPPVQIQPYQGIPDYKNPGQKPPYVIKTRTTCHCIENWPEVEKARASNQPTIMCRTKYIEQVSEMDLAIMKVATRFGNHGPEPTYAEIVSNVRRLHDFITGTQAGDVVEELVARLGKNRSTITDYINRSKYLSNDLLDGLVSRNADKRFFERLARYSKEYILALKSQRGLESENIDQLVSQATTEMVKAFIGDGLSAFKEKAEDLIEAAANTAQATSVARGRSENYGEDGEKVAAGETTESQIACIAQTEIESVTKISAGKDDIKAKDTGLGPQSIESGSQQVAALPLSVMQMKDLFYELCKTTSEIIIALEDPQLIAAALQEHQKEIVKFCSELMKIHRQQAGK